MQKTMYLSSISSIDYILWPMNHWLQKKKKKKKSIIPFSKHNCIDSVSEMLLILVTLLNWECAFSTLLQSHHCKIPPNSQDFYAEYDVCVLLKIVTLCNMVWNFPELMHNLKLLSNCHAVSCYTPFWHSILLKIYLKTIQKVWKNRPISYI